MKRGCVIALVGAAAIPVVLCVALLIGGRVVSSQIENAYGQRMQVMTAAQLRASGPRPSKVILSESQLDSAFWRMSKVLGFRPDQLEFTLSSGRIDVKGHGVFGGYLSYPYSLSVQDGRVRLKPDRQLTGKDMLGSIELSQGGLGSALEAGINQALVEAGYHVTAIDSTYKKLTIEIAPLAGS